MVGERNRAQEHDRHPLPQKKPGAYANRSHLLILENKNKAYIRMTPLKQKQNVIYQIMVFFTIHHLVGKLFFNTLAFKLFSTFSS